MPQIFQRIFSALVFLVVFDRDFIYLHTKVSSAHLYTQNIFQKLIKVKCNKPVHFYEIHTPVNTRIPATQVGSVHKLYTLK